MSEQLLPPPPPVGLVAVGEASGSIAEALGKRLPARQPHHDRGPIMVLAGADAPDSQVVEALVSARTRRGPVWCALVGWPVERIAAVDRELDNDRGVAVDSFVMLPADDSAALAAEAWIRLRHDAPSRALSALSSEGNGSRRLAAVAATEPHGPPAPEPESPSDAGALGRVRVTDALALVEARAREETSRAAGKLSEVAPGGAQAVLAQDRPPALDEAAAQSLVELCGDDVAQLSATATAAGDIGEPPAPPTAAALEVAASDAARAAEVERPGMLARLGRRRRLEELQSRYDRAVADWQVAAADHAAARARAELADRVGRLTAARLPAATEAEEASRRERSTRAERAWWEALISACGALTPPSTAAVGHATTGAGGPLPNRGQPPIRRHLLVPRVAVGVAAPPGPGSADGVLVQVAEGLHRPIAAAVVVGLPLARAAS